MRAFCLSLIAALTAVAALSLWSLAWVQWHQPSLVQAWLKPSSYGTLVIQVLVGIGLLGFAKECSNRAAASGSQLLFIGVTGGWGLAALAVAMNLTPSAWLAESPTSTQAAMLFLAGCISLVQASRATATMNGESDESEEAAESPSSEISRS